MRVRVCLPGGDDPSLKISKRERSEGECVLDSVRCESRRSRSGVERKGEEWEGILVGIISPAIHPGRLGARTYIRGKGGCVGGCGGRGCTRCVWHSPYEQ